MIALPPYALVPPTFRFRALVALADKLPLGGDREVVLATFMCARLLWDWPTVPDPADTFSHRLTSTRAWMQGLALPSATRAVFQLLLDATARRDREAARVAWERVVALTSHVTEGASRTEFRTLASQLASPTPA